MSKRKEVRFVKEGGRVLMFADDDGFKEPLAIADNEKEVVGSVKAWLIGFFPVTALGNTGAVNESAERK